MNWEKIAIACMLAYLALSLPLYLFNGQAAQQCNSACNAEGYNLVLSASSTANGLECRCFNSYGRTEKYITIGNEGGD